MAYIDATNLHALPLRHGVKGHEPAAILFPHGPRWSWRYQRNTESDRLENRFMYQDEGPPMYQLRGSHYNMYAIPPRTDHHDFCRSFHYEPRQYNAPNYRNGALAFPPGPPPSQVARFSALLPPLRREPKTAKLQIPNRPDPPSVKSWDKYRYLDGPPTESHMYGRPQAWQTGDFPATG